MEFQVKEFSDLTLQELYQILSLRAEVFVVEQKCAYQDVDNFDKGALHIFLKKEGQIIAYARGFSAGIYHEKASLGRIVVGKNFRGKNLGHALVKFSIKAIFNQYGKQVIHISAQRHLIEFYEFHNFKTVGQGYLEDGIPHIGMEVKPGGIVL